MISTCNFLKLILLERAPRVQTPAEVLQQYAGIQGTADGHTDAHIAAVWPPRDIPVNPFWIEKND